MQVANLQDGEAVKRRRQAGDYDLLAGDGEARVVIRGVGDKVSDDDGREERHQDGEEVFAHERDCNAGRK